MECAHCGKPIEGDDLDTGAEFIEYLDDGTTKRQRWHPNDECTGGFARYFVEHVRLH